MYGSAGCARRAPRLDSVASFFFWRRRGFLERAFVACGVAWAMASAATTTTPTAAAAKLAKAATGFIGIGASFQQVPAVVLAAAAMFKAASSLWAIGIFARKSRCQAMPR